MSHFIRQRFFAFVLCNQMAKLFVQNLAIYSKEIFTNVSIKFAKVNSNCVLNNPSRNSQIWSHCTINDFVEVNYVNSQYCFIINKDIRYNAKKVILYQSQEKPNGYIVVDNTFLIKLSAFLNISQVY